MNKQEQIESFTKELVELLKKGNVHLEEVYRNPDILLNHPDFDKVVDILSTIEELLNG